MGNGGKIFFAFAAYFAAAYAVFKIAGFKAKLCGNFKPKLQGAFWLFAIGGVGLRLALYAGHCHKAAYVADDSGAVLLNE